MAIVTELLCIAAVCVFVVDVSGFTDWWRGALQRLTGVRQLVPLHPFDCSLCLTWWCCLAWLLVRRVFTLEGVLFCALCAALTPVIGAAFTLLRVALTSFLEWITRLTEKLYKHGNN